jgi:hypothetical protein
MVRFFFVLSIVIVFSSCGKDEITEAPALYGTWVKATGGLPADTLRFFSKGGKDMLAFKLSATGGVNWPANVETEYRFSNGKLSVKAVSGSANEYFPADSFEWIEANKKFNVKLYQIVQYISADYRVSYRKVD